jgi:hypothetical protein
MLTIVTGVVPGTISKFAIENSQFTKGRHAPVSGAAMENGKREAAMQPPTQPIKKQARFVGLARTNAGERDSSCRINCKESSIR